MTGTIPVEESTMDKYKITTLENRRSKTVDVFVEVLQDGKSQDPEVYLKADPSGGLASVGGDTLKRADGSDMPVYATLDAKFAAALGSALRGEVRL